MIVGKFISNHKLLCGMTLGLSIVGYMGYKAVKCIVVKLGLVKETDKVAQQTLSPQQTNKTTPSSHLKGRKKDERKQIVQSPKLVQAYLDEVYNGGTPAAEKYRARLQSIEEYYNKPLVYPVRGDGNCFCNAAVAGLLSIPNCRENIALILREKLHTNQSYIQPDPTSTKDHLTKFNKEDDFALVLSGLTRTGLTTESLLENFDFTAAFSRVIRCLLSTASTDFCSPINGQETDIYSIWILNDIFDVQAELIVLAGPNEVDSDEPSLAYVVRGRSSCPFSANVDFNAEVNSKANKTEFLILRKNAHFIMLT